MDQTSVVSPKHIAFNGVEKFPVFKAVPLRDLIEKAF
jgi:hypothetical protein